MVEIGTGNRVSRPRPTRPITFDSAKAFRAWAAQWNTYSATTFLSSTTFTASSAPYNRAISPQNSGLVGAKTTLIISHSTPSGDSERMLVDGCGKENVSLGRTRPDPAGKARVPE